jgi:hypothetical protein
MAEALAFMPASINQEMGTAGTIVNIDESDVAMYLSV